MLKMHEKQEPILEKVWANRIRISCFWMVWNEVSIWNHSWGIKECNGHLRIDWKRLELGFPIASRTRFFQFENRVSEPLLLFSLDWYALYIYTGWIWNGFWKQLINIQWKSNFDILMKSNFQILSNFNPILPNLIQFRNCWHLWVDWITRKQ